MIDRKFKKRQVIESTTLASIVVPDSLVALQLCLVWSLAGRQWLCCLS